MSKYNKINLQNIKSISIQDRKSKVNFADFGKVYSPKTENFSKFIDSIPNILSAKELKNLSNDIVNAIKKGKPIILFMGAHFIKVGLSKILIDFLDMKYFNLIGLNGAGVIHDVELTKWGKTSEDVSENLKNGTFGMSKETAEFINSTLIENKNTDLGYGECIGKKLFETDSEFMELSVLANAYKNNIPVTVHVGIGTDIIFQHPNMDGSAAGELSYRDFKILCENLKNIGDGGVVLNVGSAVILPEVFLKALTVVRNLGFKADNLITANFDMFQMYRPRVNIVQRPTEDSGKGYYFIGHHEIMIPLLIAMIKNELGL